MGLNKDSHKGIDSFIFEDEKHLNMDIQELSQEEEIIGKAIVHAAYLVHSKLGPGLLEKIYEVCLAHELEKVGFVVERQVNIPIVYDDIVLMKD